MVKFISDILDSVVVLFQERAKVGEVKELIIDHEKGKFLGFVTSQYSGEGNKVVTLKNVKGFGSNIVMIDDYNSLSEVDDIIEIRKVYSSNPEILKSKVFTESGQKLGRVQNATINLENRKIEKIYVEPGLSWNLFSGQLIIPKKKIIKIEKNNIIVSDEFLTIKNKKMATAQAVISD